MKITWCSTICGQFETVEAGAAVGAAAPFAGVIWEGAKVATEVVGVATTVVEVGKKVVGVCKGDKGMV